jgi:hypothetical protein
MHPFFIFASLFPATGLSVVAFFILFATERTTGRLRTIGTVLGTWLFILAALAILAGVIGAFAAPRWAPYMMRPGMMGPGRMGAYHDQMMRDHHPEWFDQNGAAPTPAPATPPAASNSQ